MEKKILVIFVCTLMMSVAVLPITNATENKKTIKINDSNIGLLLQPPIEWEKTYGSPFAGSSYYVQQTSDGGFIATGVLFTTGGADPELYLVKTDAGGELQWSQTYGGASPFDCGYCVQQTSEGGYIIAGVYHGWGLWLIKTYSNGNQQWNKIFNSSNFDTAFYVQQTGDGGYVIAGGYTYTPGPPDMWIIKTDSFGNQQWERKVGGGNAEYGHCIRQTTDGGYIVVGYTDSYGAGLEDTRLVKLDSGGNISWIQDYGGTLDDRGNSVRQTNDGGYIIAGYTKSFGAGGSDVYLIKTDGSGNLLWSQTFGGGNDDEGNSVRQTSDGGYLICGTTQSFGSGNTDIYLIKTDSNGVKLWDKILGGTGFDFGQCADETTDGGYIITGTKFTTYSEFCLIKIGYNQPPSTPIINGPTIGKPGIKYTYNFTSTDPDGDSVSYYIEWGDGTTIWSPIMPSGATFSDSHIWSAKGTYIIKAKAKDVYGAESGWATLSVSIPRAYNTIIFRLLEQIPCMLQILRHLKSL